MSGATPKNIGQWLEHGAKGHKEVITQGSGRPNNHRPLTPAPEIQNYFCWQWGGEKGAKLATGQCDNVGGGKICRGGGTRYMGQEPILKSS